jgi:hypothetical protein
MPEPVSTTIGICWLSYAVSQGGLRGSSAYSDDAKAVGVKVTAVAQQFERSQALFGDKAAALSQLRAMAIECSQSGWDGDDASAINPVAVFIAENFVRALPNFLPLPEFAPEPDGSISLDWLPSRHRLFSISVGSNNRLAYAWLDGTNKGHAVERFDGDKIPQRLVEGINAILSHGNASVRTA